MFIGIVLSPLFTFSAVDRTWTKTRIKDSTISPYFPDTDTESGKLSNYYTLVGRAVTDNILFGVDYTHIKFRAKTAAALVSMAD